MMGATIRQNFLESTLSYEEKPREQWLFDYPAQVSLCGTQIWWTTEVNLAFARLEEGYENALKDYQRKQVNKIKQNYISGDDLLHMALKYACAYVIFIQLRFCTKCLLCSYHH